MSTAGMEFSIEGVEELAREFRGNGWEQRAHDLEYISKAMSKGFNLDEIWHNDILAMLAESFGEQFVVAAGQAVMLRGPEAMLILVRGLIEGAFIAGYIAGEGPEHIKQCRCS